MSVYLSLFLIFFRIGIFGFGGGYAMLPLIFQSIQNFGVMTAEEFSDLVALSQVTPGPIIVNAATYVGFNTAGVFGAAAAVFGVVLPSFILVLTTMHFLKKFKESRLVQGAFSGIRPATVGLIAAASVFLAQTSIVNGSLLEFSGEATDYVNVLPFAVFLCTIVLVGKFKVSPIFIMLIMGVTGAFLCG
jgi:chromate transporter